LKVMDQIIDETLRVEEQHGMYFFLQPYARSREFVMQPARSQFLDGEIAMMLAARCLLEEKSAYRNFLRDRVDQMVDRMQAAPVLAAESYPNKCWVFDNVIALVAIRASDVLDGREHRWLSARWLAAAKLRLTDPTTGLLINISTIDGEVLDPPKGSAIYMVAHCLQVLDEPFARDQYRRARAELSRSLAGFAWSREWPASRPGRSSEIPVLKLSAKATGLAVLGASSFGDDEYLSALISTIDFSGFPKRDAGELRYCAGNQLGDAVLLYASVLGPMWEKIKL